MPIANLNNPDDFDDVINYLENIKQNVEYTQIFVDQINDAYNLARDTKDKMQTDFRDKYDIYAGEVKVEYIDSVIFETIVESIREQAPFVLERNIERAASSTMEYNDPILLSPLLEAARAEFDQNFVIYEHKNGWGSSIEVYCNLNDSAGSLEDWANAVEVVRVQLGSLGKDPQKASDYWREKVYHKSWADGSYADTMQLRFEAAGQLAPYWLLLDKGNVRTKLPSDWGGTPYPTNRATNFTSDTEEELQRRFREELYDEKSINVQTARAITKQYDILTDYMNDLLDIMDKLNEIDMERASETLEHYQKIREGVNPEKVLNLISKIEQGIALPSRPVIGYTPEGRPIRPRSTTVAGLYEALYGE